ncbi:hypothetical protein TNCV_4288781 [Trichonephila clavipes]|nr:hypothetical protein TNCV_4288781 [Trichonephila clavipes]
MKKYQAVATRLTPKTPCRVVSPEILWKYLLPTKPNHLLGMSVCVASDIDCSVRSLPGGVIAYQFLHRSINHQVANRVARIDANLALSPSFRYVSVESPL